jgi:hypothetical protein
MIETLHCCTSAQLHHLSRAGPYLREEKCPSQNFIPFKFEVPFPLNRGFLPYPLPCRSDMDQCSY